MGESINNDEFGMGLFLNDDDGILDEPISDPNDPPQDPPGDPNNIDNPADPNDPPTDPNDPPVDPNEDPADPNNIEDPNEDPNDPEKVVGEDTDDDDPSGKSSSPPLYQSLANVLHEEGVLSSVDPSELKDVKDVQGLADLIAKQAKARELADLTDPQKEALKAFRDGVDPEYFAKQKHAEQQLDNITDSSIQEDEDLRRQLIYQDLINNGMSEGKANRITQQSIDSDNDIEDAKEALITMKASLTKNYQDELDRQAAATKDAEKAKVASQESLKNAILEADEIIPNFKPTKEARQQTYKNMNTAVGVNPTTGAEENALMKDQRENPSEFSSKLYFVHTVTKGFTDFSYFSKSGKNSAIKELESALAKNKHISTGGDPSFLDDPNSSDHELGETLNF